MEEKKTCYVCPVTMEKHGENKDLPENELEFEYEIGSLAKEKLDMGLIALIEIEDPKDPNKELGLNSVKRTGRVAFISRNIAEQIFDDNTSEDDIAFVSKEVMDGIHELESRTKSKSAEDIPFEEIQEEENE